MYWIGGKYSPWHFLSLFYLSSYPIKKEKKEKEKKKDNSFKQ